MNKGRQGTLGRVKVKCTNCGITFTLPPATVRARLNKNPDTHFFHVKACFYEWSRKQREVKHGI